MFCIHCGNKLSGDAKFCPNCGNAVGKRVNEKAAKEEPLHQLTIQRLSQVFAVNPPMIICIDGKEKYSIENGEEIKVTLPEGTHALEVTSSVRKKKIEVHLYADRVLTLSWNRITGAIQVDIDTSKTVIQKGEKIDVGCFSYPKGEQSFVQRVNASNEQLSEELSKLEKVDAETIENVCCPNCGSKKCKEYSIGTNDMVWICKDCSRQFRRRSHKDIYKTFRRWLIGAFGILSIMSALADAIQLSQGGLWGIPLQGLMIWVIGVVLWGLCCLIAYIFVKREVGVTAKVFFSKEEQQKIKNSVAKMAIIAVPLTVLYAVVFVKIWW